MASIINIAKIEVEDFIAVDASNLKIELTMFHGKIVPGAPGWAEHMEITPAQAREVAAALLKAAESIDGVVTVVAKA